MINFTICSNNYLAEAITLGNSLVEHHADHKSFLIFLVDKAHDSIDYSKIPFDVIVVTVDIVPDFDRICSYYDIVELNTAVKPSVFKYVISKYSTEILFSYLDPDLYFLQNIEASIQNEIGNASVLLTPHLLKPAALTQQPFENTFLNYGIYNLGFIALKPDINSLELLDWWEERTLKLGVNNVKEGFFVDQLWLNLAPIFFKGIKISLNPGLNMAYWNINERSITKIDDMFYVNKVFPLIFFHFSSFDLSLKKLSKREYSFPEWDILPLKELMRNYKYNLLVNAYDFYRSISPNYRVTFESFIKKTFQADVDKVKILRIKKIIKHVPNLLVRKFLNLAHIISVLKEKEK